MGSLFWNVGHTGVSSLYHSFNSDAHSWSSPPSTAVKLCMATALSIFSSSMLGLPECGCLNPRPAFLFSRNQVTCPSSCSRLFLHLLLFTLPKPSSLFTLSFARIFTARCGSLNLSPPQASDPALVNSRHALVSSAFPRAGDSDTFHMHLKIWKRL